MCCSCSCALRASMPVRYREGVRNREEDIGQEYESVYITACSRYPEEFRQTLLTGETLEACREAMAAAGCPCELPSGAKVFCSPSQYNLIKDATVNFEGKLRPYHVLSSERYHGVVMTAIRSMRRALKVKVKWQSVCAYISEKDFLLPSQAKLISNQWPSDGRSVDMGEHSDFDINSLSLDSLFTDSAGGFSTLEYPGDILGTDMHPAKLVNDKSQDRTQGSAVDAESSNPWFTLAPGPRPAPRSRPPTLRANDDAAKSDMFAPESRENPWFAMSSDPWRPTHRASGRGRDDAHASSTWGHERMEHPTIPRDGAGSSPWFRTGPADFIPSMWGQAVDRKKELD